MIPARTACFSCSAAQLRVAPPLPSLSRCPIATPRPLRSSRPRHTGATIPSLRHAPAAAAAPAILWIGAGTLRLSDCGAVAAAAASTSTLLPVAVLSMSEIRDCATALHHLRERLLRLESALVVRIVENNAAKGIALAEVAQAVRARVVFANAALAHIQTPAQLRVHFCPDALVEAPRRFPPLPTATRAVHHDPLPGIGTGASGETVALERLQTLVSKKMHLHVVLRMLNMELRVGSLARCRVIAACSVGKVSTSAPSALRLHSAAAGTVGIVGAYDVLGNDRRGVEWDEETKSFRLKQWEHTAAERRMTPSQRWAEFIRRRREFLIKAFFPPDVTPDYYAFTAWRVSQRCVSATVGVFGTQSLLLALGVRSGRIGQAAAISWVLKDGLGRVGKMIWASGMGKDFDVDPKRWRFRSALLYAFGNGLEIVTQLFPSSFLLFATAANSMKQVSMLTSSATRNAMYRSFGDKSQNIANITAKGEAQIVIADLIGMCCGIRLSKLIGTSKGSVLAAYSILTMLDIFGIYMELRQVVFRTLNPERSTLVIEQYIDKGTVLSPARVSARERIFRRPRYKLRTRFSSIAKAAQSPEELASLLRVFRREHYLVSWPGKGGTTPCRIVLRRDATNDDVLRALLTAGHIIKASREANGNVSREEEEAILRNSRKAANNSYQDFNRSLKEVGWNTDNLLFGTLKRRGYWRREREGAHATPAT